MDTERVRLLKTEVLSDAWGVLERRTFELRRRDGAWQRQSRETYDRGNGAAILLHDPEQRTVVLIRQFRLPAFVNGDPGWLIEVPAGLLDDAGPAERIRAEVQEETGFCVNNVVPVFDLFMSPGSVTERLHLFVGRVQPSDRVREGGGALAEGEDIEVLVVPFDDAMAMVRSGAIRDAKTIILLQHLALTVFRA